MARKAVVTRVALNAGTGTQDITTTKLGGQTPNAAIFIVSGATSDGTARDTGIIGIGAATATDEEWAVSFWDEHGQANTDNSRRGVKDMCILVLNDTAIDGEAEFSAFITNGVRINITDAFAEQYLLTVLLFVADDAYAGTFDLANTKDTAVDVETGFLPQVVLASWMYNPMSDTAYGEGVTGLGVALNGGGQYSHGTRFANGKSVGDPRAAIYDDYAVIGVYSTSVLNAVEFSDYTVNGFKAYTRLANAGNEEVGYLALDFGDLDVAAGVLDTPASTGSASVTAPNFRPGFVMGGVTDMTAVDTFKADASAGPLGVFAFDDEDEYCVSICSEDASATTNTQSLSDDTAVNLPEDAGGANLAAAFSAFTSTGWNWTWSNTPGSARKYWYFALEGAPITRRIFITHA